MLVSVIVPLKNAQDYVACALTSILSEKDTPLEVVVVNDRCTDASLDRVREIEDERMRVVDAPGRGISACLNVGLVEAQGDIIMRCDADDLYPPGRIKEQVSWLRSHPDIDAVCGGFSMIDAHGSVVTELRFGDDEAEITDELAHGTVRTHLCTYAVRSSLIGSVGGFREYFETAEDIDFQLRMGEMGRITCVPENWYHYRIHASSITHTQRTSLRAYFKEYACELQRQRRAGKRDALQMGQAPCNSDDAMALDKPLSADDHIQGLLLGRAWQEHRTGQKTRALRTGLRALMVNPRRKAVWKSVGSLAIKPARNIGAEF